MSGSNVRRWAALVVMACFGSASAQAVAQAAETAAAAPTELANSALDAPLFYHLLLGEMELSSGRAGNAFELILEAARRQADGVLFQRAIDIALQARAGDQALGASRAWRTALPESVDAVRYQFQILLALNRVDELAEPIATWLSRVAAAERVALITGLPRALQRAADRRQARALLEQAVSPYADKPETRLASLVAVGRMALAAGQAEHALALARQSALEDPAAPGPVLLALDLPAGTLGAEAIVTAYLARPDAEPALRLAHVRNLALALRHGEAITQLQQITRERPEVPEPWLTLGALHVDLKQPGEAEAALQHYIALRGKPGAKPLSAQAEDEDVAGTDSPSSPPDAAQDLTQAWLLLAQAAEQRGDVKTAESWLARIDNPQRALEVQVRRASLLARQGQVQQARQLIQSTPERTGEDARAKLMAEAQMLRELKRWPDAAEVLKAAGQRYPDDADLLYEWAMIEEKLDHLAEMERLLRRVIEIKPEHPHAHNALGYSLADRNLRLPEARELINKALAMSPGDPFITDSLAWVEFRLGRRDEALRLLRQAYQARPDTEIGAHLGEVLWTLGQREEARRIWIEARSRDASNEVLRETLSRLKVKL